MFESITNSRPYQWTKSGLSAVWQTTNHAGEGYLMGVYGLVAWWGAMIYLGGFGKIGALKVALGLIIGSSMLNGMRFVKNNNDFNWNKIIGGVVGAVVGYMFLGPLGMGLCASLGRELGETAIMKPQNMWWAIKGIFSGIKYLATQGLSLVFNKSANDVASQISQDTTALLGTMPDSIKPVVNGALTLGSYVPGLNMILPAPNYN